MPDAKPRAPTGDSSPMALDKTAHSEDAAKPSSGPPAPSASSVPPASSAERASSDTDDIGLAPTLAGRRTIGRY